MANWKYTINLKPVWEKYTDYSHEDYDNDIDLFVKMKTEIVSALKKEIKPGDYSEIKDLIDSMQKSKHLSGFNNLFNKLYDFCDYKKIWLKTQF